MSRRAGPVCRPTPRRTPPGSEPPRPGRRAGPAIRSACVRSRSAARRLSANTASTTKCDGPYAVNSRCAEFSSINSLFIDNDGRRRPPSSGLRAGMSAGPLRSGARDLDLERLVLGLLAGRTADRTLADDPVALAFVRHLRLRDVPVAPDPEGEVGKVDRQQGTYAGPSERVRSAANRGCVSGPVVCTAPTAMFSSPSAPEQDHIACDLSRSARHDNLRRHRLMPTSRRSAGPPPRPKWTTNSSLPTWPPQRRPPPRRAVERADDTTRVSAHQVAMPTARSRSVSESSRCISSRCRCGTLRRQPTRPKSRLSALLVMVMLSAWPSSAIDSG